MKPLTPEIAQEIACEADKIINHGVLITDENGYVIGSSDPNRINTLHEASLLVMKRRKPAYLNAEACTKYAGTRPGVTFPVSLSGNIVGSVGITGQLEDVAQFGQLIRMFVEVFLKDHLNQEMDDLREQGHYDLLTEIVSYGAPNGAEEETILRHGQALGYNLTLQRVVFVVEALYLPGQTISEFRNYSRIIRRVFTDPQDFYVKITPDKFTVFSHVVDYSEKEREQNVIRQRANILLDTLRLSGHNVHIGISSTTHGVAGLRKAYFEAHEALHICKLSGDPSGILFIRQSYLERLVYNISEDVYQSFFDDNLRILTEQKDGDNLMQVIRVWCECRFNATEASDILHIHKNTLSYRMDRIKKLTGLDLRNFKEAAALYVGVTLYHIKQTNINI